MNKLTIFFSVLLSLLYSWPLLAQTGDDQLFTPENPNRSVLFGKDIVIKNQPEFNQRDAVICQAFNGWLYSAYWVPDPTSIFHIYMFRSTDNGISWSSFNDFTTGWDNEYLTSLCLATTGNDLSNLKVFLGYVLRDTMTDGGRASVYRHNGVNGTPEADVLNELSYQYRDLSIASDCSFPAAGANPNSFAIVFSKPNNYETIKASVSMDGGFTFQNKVVKEDDEKKITKVSVAYGSSLSDPNGKYYLAWETRDYGAANAGKIYVAHSNPNPNSPFTEPVCIDDLDPGITEKCKNPKVACQYGPLNNDSSNVTTLVLFETENVNTGFNDVMGFYNLQTTLTSHYRPISLTNPNHHNSSADIAFNPYDSTFMVTYYDSTDKKIPFLASDLNITNPDSWDIISTGYNDALIYKHPTPRVIANNLEHSGANVWIADGINGNGIAMFDAAYSTYTQINNKDLPPEVRMISVYPNPCSSILTMEFELENQKNVMIKITTPLGQTKEVITNMGYNPGKYQIGYDISTLVPGCYIYTFTTEGYSTYGKVIKK